MKIVRIPHGSLFYFVLAFCIISVLFQSSNCISWRAQKFTWTVPPKLPFLFSDIFLALGYEYRCQKPLNLKSFQTYSGQRGASQHQQVKFIRPYLDLGIVPIKQNRAVEQQSNGPLGIRPNALRLKFMLL